MKGKKKPSKEKNIPLEKDLTIDNPDKRHNDLILDMMSGKAKKDFVKLRLQALKQMNKKEEFDIRHTVVPEENKSNWIQLGPTAIPNGQTNSDERVLVTGRTTSIAIDPRDPQCIYIGSALGGIWKSTDGGKNWASKSAHELSLAIGAIAMDPTNSDILYVGTGEGNFSGDSYYGLGVLKSIDGGETWNRIEGDFIGARFFRIAVDPKNPSHVYAATTIGLYRSTDSGSTWNLMSKGLGTTSRKEATDVIIDPESNSVYAAFYTSGIYKTDEAEKANPRWIKLTNGIPSIGIGRISLGMSQTSPQTLFALIANNKKKIDKFYRTTDGGTIWNKISLPREGIGGNQRAWDQGNYNNVLAVDPTTPDIVYLGAVTLFKGIRDPTTNDWGFYDIGFKIHSDNHALGFDPEDNQIIYALNDGGIYKSPDGGDTWDDTINEGLCITQFEFIEQHPISDAVVFGGTQDNGTEQFCNSSVFHHAADGDGGFCEIDYNDPKTIIHTYYNPSPMISKQGGKFGTFAYAFTNDLYETDSLFYPPITLDESNPKNIAIGTKSHIHLDSNQGLNGWPIKIPLPDSRSYISAIHYVRSDLIYCAGATGVVYRITKTNGVWSVRSLHQSPLPNAWIWDVYALPNNEDSIIVILAGFGTINSPMQHVWRGDITDDDISWTSISSNLPDIPVNAIQIEEEDPEIMYIGTDIGCWRTLDGGTSWHNFSEGLPNSAVYDMRLHQPTRMLRVGTHGFGMWERNVDEITPNVDLFVRNNSMDTARRVQPTIEAAFEDERQHVALGDTLYWWMCADIKVDTLEGTTSPSFQMKKEDVDYLAFENKLYHRNPKLGQTNRVYVQIHNRGIIDASNVTVKILYSDSSTDLADLPQNFWSGFPGNSFDQSNWKPVGEQKIVPLLSTTKPQIVEFDWNIPSDASENMALLILISCVQDPILEEERVFQIKELVTASKHVGLKRM